MRAKRACHAALVLTVVSAFACNDDDPLPAAPPSALLSFHVVSAGLLDGTSTGWEQARDVAFDDQGAIYVVGGTSAPDFPVTTGALDTSYNIGGSELGSLGNSDAFVTKIDATGTIVWSTYLGGPNYDRAYAVEVDASRNVYVAGRAGPGFPTTEGTLQAGFAGDNQGPGAYGSQDGFVTKLRADGTGIIWSTYFGDAGPAFIRDLAVDGANRIHVAADMSADMSRYVTAGAAQSNRRGNFDVFYARLSADGRRAEYGTYLGGHDAGGIYSGNPSVRVLSDGTAFVLAADPGDGGPTTPGALQRNSAGGFDLLLAKFSPAGHMAFCTYLGGSLNELMDTHSLALRSDGNAVIGAETHSSNYPLTDSSRVASSNGDIAITVVSSDGTRILHSRVLGGNQVDGAEGIGVDSDNNVYVTGLTRSSDLPVTANALSPSHLGSLEGILLVFSPDLSIARYVSYDGIPGEFANRASVVNNGLWAVVGAVWHMAAFPATAGNDTRIDGEHAAFFRVLSAR